MVYIKQRWNAQFFSIPPNLIIEESYLQTFLHTLLFAILDAALHIWYILYISCLKQIFVLAALRLHFHL